MSPNCIDEPCVSEDNSTDKQVEQPENRSVIEALKRVFLPETLSLYGHHWQHRFSPTANTPTPIFRQPTLDNALSEHLSDAPGFVSLWEAGGDGVQRRAITFFLDLAELTVEDYTCPFFEGRDLPSLLSLQGENLVLYIFLDTPLPPAIGQWLRDEMFGDSRRSFNRGTRLPDMSTKFFDTKTDTWRGIEYLTDFEVVPSTESVIRFHEEKTRKPDVPPEAEPIKFGEFLTDRDFSRMDSKPEFVIDGVIPFGSYGFIAAREKHFKSSISMDIAVSVATGTPFLGKFNVPEPRKVFFASDETVSTDKLRLRAAILANREVDTELLRNNLHWSAGLPDISSDEDLQAFETFCEDNPGCLIIFDPFNHCLGSLSGQTQSRSVMTQRLRLWSQVSKRHSVTLLFNHHCNSNLHPGIQPTLSHLSGTGPAEWGRFHLMLNQKVAYDPDTGVMQLFMAITGNAQMGGKHILEVNEGPDKTEWKPVVRRLDEFKEAQDNQKRDERESLLYEVSRAIAEGLRIAGGSLSRGGIADLPEVKFSRRSETLRDAIEVALEEQLIVSEEKATGVYYRFNGPAGS